MTNKYLEKIAADHILKGLISPAWQQHAIAKEHGHRGPEGLGPNITSHFVGTGRAGGRAWLDGTGLRVAGRLIGSVGGTKGEEAGAALGTLAGSVHGYYKSLKNQAKEHHEDYSQHKSAGLLEKIAARLDRDSTGNIAKGTIMPAVLGAGIGAALGSSKAVSPYSAKFRANSPAKFGGKIMEKGYQKLESAARTKGAFKGAGKGAAIGAGVALSTAGLSYLNKKLHK